MRKCLLMLLYGLLILCIPDALADSVTVMVNSTGGSVGIHSTELDGEEWIFLPSYADRDDLHLSSGQKLLLSGGEDGTWLAEGVDEPIHVMQSENLRTLYLVSDDPVEKGRSYIENCDRHENEASAMMALVGVDGAVDHACAITRLRGRGNGTWTMDKRAYQIKLEERRNLLDTENPDESSRTWVLLAEAFDPSLLRSRISLDLARELGLEQTARCEHVDLYYDGEYRGTYMLCEKTEIGPGRIDELDYDELIEEWNEAIGQHDLESLPVAQGQNRYGHTFTYVEGLADNGDPAAGAYLLEMESEATLSDRCWFTLGDGNIVAVKNPENSSERMMRYISETMEDARQTLRNGGVHSQNGAAADDYFDIDGFARAALIHELAYNLDGYRYSSSYFVLPADSACLEPGAVWDFDQGWRYHLNGYNANGRTLKDPNGSGWLQSFYRVPSFLTAMQQIFSEELYPLIQNVLLGTKEGRYLKPLEVYAAHTAASRRMNERLHGMSIHGRMIGGENADGDVALFRKFVEERTAWLYDAVMRGRTDADNVTLWLDAAYLGLEFNDIRLQVCPWSHVELKSCSYEKLTDATEEDYALWQMDAEIAPASEDIPFKQPVVTINETEVGYTLLENGHLQISVTFEDPSYRPVDGWGEDIGLVYNPDEYARRYPEIAQMCENDPEQLLEYFLYDGMYEGHQGNAFFNPRQILSSNPLMADMFGEDWSLYYSDFMAYGLNEGWLDNLNPRFHPQVVSCLPLAERSDP